MTEAMVDTLCFIPCCKRKTECQNDPTKTSILTERHIPESWQILQSGRKEMSVCIERNMRPCVALRQYRGDLYKSESDFLESVMHHLKIGWLDVYIVSAGYGLVHALDPIHPYEAEMKGKTATLWRDVGLVRVISELIRLSRVQRVFGFFAGPSHWPGFSCEVSISLHRGCQDGNCERCDDRYRSMLPPRSRPRIKRHKRSTRPYLSAWTACELLLPFSG